MKKISIKNTLKILENSSPKNNAFLEMNWKKIRHANAF